MTGILLAAVFVSVFLLLLYISTLGQSKSENREPVTLKGLLKKANDQLKVLLVRKKKSGKKKDSLEQSLNAAGVPMKAEEFVVFQGFAVIIGGGLLYLLSNQFVLFLFGTMLGFLTPKLWLKKKQQKRIKQFNEGLPGMITSINGSLRAGFSLLQSLQMIAEEAYSPIKEEVQYVLKTMQYGTSLEDALVDWKRRMPSEDLDLLVEAVLIQRQVGGNLAYLLDKILETTRERTRIENQIKTLTAQGRLSGIVISLLPVGLGAMIYFINPEYITVLFVNPIGKMMLAVALVGGIIGFIFIRKITTIEV
ncbi:type II secretion system F family protein [Sediminibacillus massiliensis]|uniref:type II secretion system F family protein n=1 Tax=Sediminibacillus massiliensis TaxID=1926277 RepID=UPI000988415B|nr:type II secretion system F family protein [Sediminibacillus massiliensis]